MAKRPASVTWKALNLQTLTVPEFFELLNLANYVSENVERDINDIEYSLRKKNQKLSPTQSAIFGYAKAWSKGRYPMKQVLSITQSEEKFLYLRNDRSTFINYLKIMTQFLKETDKEMEQLKTKKKVTVETTKMHDQYCKNMEVLRKYLKVSTNSDAIKALKKVTEYFQQSPHYPASHHASENIPENVENQTPSKQPGKETSSGATKGGNPTPKQPVKAHAIGVQSGNKNGGSYGTQIPNQQSGQGASLVTPQGEKKGPAPQPLNNTSSSHQGGKLPGHPDRPTNSMNSTPPPDYSAAQPNGTVPRREDLTAMVVELMHQRSEIDEEIQLCKQLQVLRQETMQLEDMFKSLTKKNPGHQKTTPIKPVAENYVDFLKKEWTDTHRQMNSEKDPEGVHTFLCKLLLKLEEAANDYFLNTLLNLANPCAGFSLPHGDPGAQNNKIIKLKDKLARLLQDQLLSVVNMEPIIKSVAPYVTEEMSSNKLPITSADQFNVFLRAGAQIAWQIALTPGHGFYISNTLKFRDYTYSTLDGSRARENERIEFNVAPGLMDNDRLVLVKGIVWVRR